MSTSTLRYRYRVYPTLNQKQFLAQSFGCARVVYNDAIAARREAYEKKLPYPTRSALNKAMACSKKTPERVWLSDVSSTALQSAVIDADIAYQNFFASVKGKRKGKRIGPPRFRSRKDHRQTLRFTGMANFAVRKVSANKALLRLPKMGELKLALSRDLPSNPSSVTLIKEADGRYYVSFVVKVEDRTLPVVKKQIGIDFGLAHLAVTVDSDGVENKVENPRYLRKKLHKLATAQKELARRQKGSANRAKSRLRVAKLHRAVRETRLDAHHKLARQIINENQVVVLENLSITGLVKTLLAKSISDAGWGLLTGLIEEKALRAGRMVIRADRFFPSTRLCSSCGALSSKKALNVRTWSCACGAVHDRDINAAKNLLHLAVGHTES